MKNLILYQKKKNILKLTLNNPKSQNTLSKEMISLLKYNFKKASNDKDVKVIILAAKGPVFCAGHNLKDLDSKKLNPDRGKLYYNKLIKSCSNLMLYIQNLSKPVIAEVDGIATAAGCQLVATCDLAYSSEKAKFATPGVNIGLFCSTPMVPISRIISKKHIMEMLLTGELIDSKKASRIGLINNYFSSNLLSKKVFEIATKISNKSSKTLKIGKNAFYKQKEMSIQEAYKYTSTVMTKNLLLYESKEGINAFLKKRKPNWKD